MVVDTFAIDPGDLADPCANDITDDRLYVAPSSGSATATA